jgi:AraC family transcriptional regulator
VTKALSILSGAFGRVALLDMDTSLVDHAHHHCHVIMKASGPDQDFTVEGQPYPIRDDTAVAVNTWQEHEYLHKAGTERTLFLAMYIEPGWLAEADRSFAACSSPGFFAEPSLRLSPEVQRLRNTLVHQLAFDPAGNTAEIEDRILDLTLELVHRFSNWRARPGDARRLQDFRIRRAVRNMREQVGERLDLDRVAAASGLSRPHFNHLFRRCTGVSPAVYGNALRVEVAVGALRNAEQGIGAISDELGFSAQSNFTRFFQQHTGTSPNQFRRAMACLA